SARYPTHAGVSDTPRPICAIASAAIHVSTCRAMDCFAALAMTVDMVSRSRDALRPRLARNSPPSKTEGAGNAGCTLHPRSRVHDVVRCAHEHTGTVGTLRHSLRNGLTAYAVLSLETNSSCLHRCRLDGSTKSVGLISPP